MKKTLEIDKITVIHSLGTDLVMVDCQGASSMPKIVKLLTFKVECEQGYGEQWVRNFFGFEPDLVIWG